MLYAVRYSYESVNSGREYEGLADHVFKTFQEAWDASRILQQGVRENYPWIIHFSARPERLDGFEEILRDL